MKTYTYKFADGAESVVKVEDHLYDLLTEMDKAELGGNRRETRRHISMEKLAELGVEPSIADEYFSDETLGDIKDERMQNALKTLTEKQKEVVLKAAVDGMSFRKIAEEMGLNKDTVREYYWVGIKKLQEFL